jgi:DNA-binding MarR family transcriptional regulator
VLERRRDILERIVSVLERDGGALTGGYVPPRVIAEGIVGAVASVLHARLLDGGESSLLELIKPLTSIVVLPYLGTAIARRELARAQPTVKSAAATRHEGDALLELPARLTYRTVRVLLAIAAAPGSSNREVGGAAGIYDQGQTSKLLRRLKRAGLIRNTRNANARGAPNVWTLTSQGRAVQRAMDANLAEGIFQ